MTIRGIWKQDQKFDKSGYLSDFYKFFGNLKESFRKIEFGQTFAEPGNASWEAFIQGDWNRAIDLVSERTENAKKYFAGLAAKNIKAFRVRVVTEPFSDYLIWELNVLRNNELLGEEIRVVRAQDVSEVVSPTYLDDYVAIDEVVAYRVLYNENGHNVGAERSIDATSVAGVTNAFDELFGHGEPLNRFFLREIKNIKPKNAMT